MQDEAASEGFVQRLRLQTVSGAGVEGAGSGQIGVGRMGENSSATDYMCELTISVRFSLGC